MKNKTDSGKTDEILFLTSYPPRECGIATYSQDLVKALGNKFSNSFSVKVCALESNGITYPYPKEVKYTLKTSLAADFANLSAIINRDQVVKIVLIQHEFGFFQNQERAFLQFLYELTKPVVVVFHTVLPGPGEELKLKVRNIAAACDSVIVMTNHSVDILVNDYGVARQKITMIAHGTHLVPHLSEKYLKLKYGLSERKVLTTFGLLSSGKSIETTLDALPAIIRADHTVVFLIIGKTHPEVVKKEGEKYREMLMQKVHDLNIEDHVFFINKYLPLPDLLEYLQLTDIYLFTTNDPNQAVSGTFAYAMSCACPIISTPIPHALELLITDTGIIFDFLDSGQLSESVIRLLGDEPLRRNMSTNTLEKIVSTAWENSAVAHAFLFERISGNQTGIAFDLPGINLAHLKKMTTETGIIQFSKNNQPDITSGYTLDDNARALIASCMYFHLVGGEEPPGEINKYLRFISICQQPGGNFLNYLDQENKFTSQNHTTNLDDANGRAIWALGYVVSLMGPMPLQMVSEAEQMLRRALAHIENTHSTRAMAFAIKGLYFYQDTLRSPQILALIKTLADRLVQMYRHESGKGWEWFESYLTYANSTLPEAMLYAFLTTREHVYKEIAISSLRFLLSQIFNENGIEVISNKNWLQKGGVATRSGEQPIDVSYTIMTLSMFYDTFHEESYLLNMETAFNWFSGNNRLHQIVYNPCTGGCYDGLEETHVNLNQGAESTVSYLMARLTMERYVNFGRQTAPLLPKRKKPTTHPVIFDVGII